MRKKQQRTPRGSYVTHRELNGGKRTLAGPAPRDFKPRPWFNLVCNLTIASASETSYFTNKDIIVAAVNQLGLNAADTAIMVVKLHSVDAWAVPEASSTDRPAVSLDVSSLIPQVEDTTVAPVAIVYPILMKLKDVGNLSQAAKVGYNWPASQSLMPLGFQAEHTVISVSGNVENTTVRIRLQFSFGGEAIPPP